MAIVMSMRWAGVTPEQYEAARERVGWEVDQPTGGRVHVAWFDDDALCVTDVWESAADFEAFARDRLLPIVKGEPGLEGEPDVAFSPLQAVFLAEAAKA